MRKLFIISDAGAVEVRCGVCKHRILEGSAGRWSYCKKLNDLVTVESEEEPVVVPLDFGCVLFESIC